MSALTTSAAAIASSTGHTVTTREYTGSARLPGARSSKITVHCGPSELQSSPLNSVLQAAHDDLEAVAPSIGALGMRIAVPLICRASSAAKSCGVLAPPFSTKIVRRGAGILVENGGIRRRLPADALEKLVVGKVFPADHHARQFRPEHDVGRIVVFGQIPDRIHRLATAPGHAHIASQRHVRCDVGVSGGK